MGVCQSVFYHAGDCFYSFAWWHHFNAAISHLFNLQYSTTEMLAISNVNFLIAVRWQSCASKMCDDA